MLTVRVLPQWSRKLYTKPQHKNGLAFLPNRQYTVQGFDRQDTDGYVILVNEYNEIWWINNRHVRVVQQKAKNPVPAGYNITGSLKKGAGYYLFIYAENSTTVAKWDGNRFVQPNGNSYNITEVAWKIFQQFENKK